MSVYRRAPCLSCSLPAQICDFLSFYQRAPELPVTTRMSVPRIKCLSCSFPAQICDFLSFYQRAPRPSVTPVNLTCSHFFSRKRGSTEESEYRSNSRKLSANRLFRGRSVPFPGIECLQLRDFILCLRWPAL
jgi:hypothetical protein